MSRREDSNYPEERRREVSRRDARWAAVKPAGQTAAVRVDPTVAFKSSQTV